MGNIVSLSTEQSLMLFTAKSALHSENHIKPKKRTVWAEFLDSNVK
jgi:hypothetical protein